MSISCSQVCGMNLSSEIRESRLGIRRTIPTSVLYRSGHPPQLVLSDDVRCKCLALTKSQ